jgi:putative hydrolase of the HAD superfamily
MGRSRGSGADLIDTVFFDASGTLIEVAEPVGETYARFARAEGAVVSRDALSAAFKAAFAAAPPLAFPVSSKTTTRRRERAWWRARVAETFARAGVGLPRAAFERAFSAAFDHFARGSAWRVFDDVRPTLAELRRRGVRAAVVSNFDSRLRAVLAAHGLAEAFDALVLSTECGFAKPDPRIFAHALRACGASASTTLHVGDSRPVDVEGARRAGIRAVCIDRSRPPARGRIAALTANTLLNAR